MKKLTLPCRVGSVSMRQSAGDGLNVCYKDRIYSVGGGLALTAVFDDGGSVARLWDSPDCAVFGYKFRGGLSGMSQCDIVFIVLDGSGSVKVGAAEVPYGSGDVLDLTECTQKFVFEAPTETRLLKIELN